MHYNNPDLLEGVIDSSGMRVYYTYHLREYPVAALWAGINWTPQHFIPPQQENVLNVGLCSSKCIGAAMEQNGINEFRIISALLHAHQTTKAVRVRQFRNGKELRVIDVNNAYDFQYQQWVDLFDEQIILLPTDDLVIECNHSTIGRDYFTFGGFGMYLFGDYIYEDVTP